MDTQSFEKLTSAQKRTHKYVVRPLFVIAGLIGCFLAGISIYEMLSEEGLSFQEAAGYLAFALSINLALLEFYSLPIKGWFSLGFKVRHIIALVALVLSFVGVFPSGFMF
ncbi:hypothetical protein [Idiomarina sp. OXR-189]|uniref:hypothetical protein n=1 Tax=Idiomarina sp. OXR-189 TaxID=3100175 RepID=UPI002AC8FE9B|nr:hypothetical protein [Idiomarina sp. OXR-189]WPZ01526.1 hypothetical protein UM402_01060 [Idiomarina sp. OXR-189]